MYDVSISQDIVLAKLNEITDSLNSLLSCKGDDGGFAAGEDIRWPYSVCNTCTVDSTSEIGFAIYYGLKMFIVEKEKSNNIINNVEIDKWINKFELGLSEIIKWLIDQKNDTDGGWGSLKGLTSRVITTSVTTNLFYTLIHDTDPRIIKIANKHELKKHYNSGINWFITTKKPSGGWGFTKDGKPNTASTSLALLTLMTTKISENENIVKENIQLINDGKFEDTGKEYCELEPGYGASISYRPVTLKTLALLTYYKDEIFSDNISEEIMLKNIKLIKQDLNKTKKNTYYSDDPNLKSPSPIFTYLNSRCLLVYYSLYLTHRLVKPLIELEKDPIELINNCKNNTIRVPF